MSYSYLRVQAGVWVYSAQSSFSSSNGTGTPDLVRPRNWFKNTYSAVVGGTVTVFSSHLSQRMSSADWYRLLSLAIQPISAGPKSNIDARTYKYMLYHRVPKFWTYGSVCCACTQRPGLPRACHSG